MIWHAYLNPFRDVLARLFPLQSDARTAAATAGLDLTAIAFDARAINTWQAIIEEAHRHDKIDALIAYATARFPEDAALAAARKTYEDGMTAGHEEAPPGQPAASAQPASSVTINIGSGGTINGSTISFGNVTSGDNTAGAGQHQELVRLRKLMVDRLSNSDLHDLCFDLSIDYDDLSGEGRAGKARGLLEYCSRRDRVTDLITTGKALRPDMPWHTG